MMGRVLRRFALAVVVVLVIALVAGAIHYVPFEPVSYAAWIGIAVAFAGLISLAVPLRFLAIRDRRRALLALAAGVALALAGVLWPASVVRPAGPHKRLDDFLPEYQLSERHEASTRAPRAAVLEAVRNVSLADMPPAVFLMRLRGGRLRGAPPSRRPLLDLMLRPGSGFFALDVADSADLVLGMAGKPWANERPPRIASAGEFRRFDAPGQIRVAFDIRVIEAGDGTLRVSTETRSLGNDAEARRVFARYWRVIYPGSAIIRRVWLDAIIARAERRSGV